MLINKYKINLSTLPSGTTATTINIPLNMEYQVVDNAELVDRVFVKTEVDKSINPIYDYEKVRFIPVNENDLPIDSITYSLSLDGNNTYGSIGFDNNDIRYGKESFKQSFLNLSFYDSPNRLTQNLISNVTLYSKLSSDDYHGNYNQPNVGRPIPAADITLKFEVVNPLFFPLNESEGYHLYDYKSELSVDESKFLYMRATFKNAKDGTQTNLMVNSVVQPIDLLVNDLYTKYELFRTETDFYYKIIDNWVGNDPLNSGSTNNVINVNNSVKINLYKINVI